jgi:predicted Zn-dependent protease
MEKIGKKRLLSDLEALISMLYNHITENPNITNVYNLLAQHREEIMKCKTDSEALEKAEAFKTKYSRHIKEALQDIMFRSI